jgi:hypothetical protein
MILPSRDEFEAWRADPVTVFVMSAMQAVADAQAADWLAKAWDGGDLSEVLRERLRTRAETFRELVGLTFEDAYGANGLEAPSNPEFEAVSGRLA